MATDARMRVQAFNAEGYYFELCSQLQRQREQLAAMTRRCELAVSATTAAPRGDVVDISATIRAGAVGGQEGRLGPPAATFMRAWAHEMLSSTRTSPVRHLKRTLLAQMAS